MAIPQWLEKAYFGVIDQTFRYWPQSTPEISRIRNCKIVSHRGEHDNSKIIENTLEAFDQAVAAGVWGVELDIRWTSDLYPVVVHDADLQRIFNSQLVVNEVTLADLKQQFPQIPTLEEVVKKYGGKTHLMVELKKEFYPQPIRQNEILSRIFSHLKPCRDYHWITLDLEMFGHVTYAPAGSFLLVAELNITKCSQISISKNFGGITGHYSLLSSQISKKHHSAGQKIGTGFISSKNALFKELNRDIDWIFTNHAVWLQNFCDGYGEEGSL